MVEGVFKFDSISLIEVTEKLHPKPERKSDVFVKKLSVVQIVLKDDH